MQFDQSEISSRIICKATYTYMYDSVNIHCNTLVMDDGEENGQYKTRTADYGLRTTDWV